MVDALSALIRQNADETTRLKREVQRDLLVKKNDVGDKSVLRLVTDIHIFFQDTRFQEQQDATERTLRRRGCGTN